MRTPLITAEEGGDEPGHFCGAVEQEYMTSMPDDMQLCVRDAPGKDPAVGCRHDGVVAGQHQGLLPQGA